MSKAERRKDIKRKEDLQARFKFALSQNNSKVSNWLKAPTDQDLNENRDKSFLDLPVIQNGGGLSSSSYESGRRVKDFISADNSMIQKSQKHDKLAPKQQGSSRALDSLMNRMRSENRSKVKKATTSNDQKSISTSANSNNSNQSNKKDVHEEDSDDDDALRHRTVRKGSNLLFESKMKKSRRPF
ncbi:uncharacterized protein PRCAT00000348001 [Priceomyces carsonii]|uniref:uncharacterized protein n=1 Tax=Priceomyces carsonii TaxID=28549 RepID=UPI002ED8FFFE|nr:unnamed protein product [Priceomyces carsonii]